MSKTPSEIGMWLLGASLTVALAMGSCAANGFSRELDAQGKRLESLELVSPLSRERLAVSETEIKALKESQQRIEQQLTEVMKELKRGKEQQRP